MGESNKSKKRAKVAGAAVLAVALAFGIAAAPAGAQDQNAVFLIQLYNNVCLRFLNKPDEVRAWAREKQLPPITDQGVRDSFVGPGARGDAWIVPSPTGDRFAISIRAATQGCAAWAIKADPNYVIPAFIQQIEGFARPGYEVRKDNEESHDTPFGIGRSMSYYMRNLSNNVGFEFSAVTAERPGGVFQATLQVTKVEPH